MGKYKYFDQIIKQDDYLSIVGLFNRELDLLCSDMIRALVKGINDWEKEYIFKVDFEEYAKFYVNTKNKSKTYVPNMLRQYGDYKTIYKSFDGIVNNITPLNNQPDPESFANDLVNAINSGGYKADFDLESIDFAGKIKLIRIRLFGDDNNIVKKKDSRNKNNEVFDSFLNGLTALRNETDGHASVLDRETVSFSDVKAKLYEIYNMMPAVIDDLDNVFKKTAEIKKVLEFFKDYKLDYFIKEYELAHCPECVRISKTELIDVEEIFSYNIFIEYSAMMSPYNQVLTQKLFEKIKAGKKKIFYDKKSVERLKETVYSKNGILSERARNFQHQLNSIRDNVEWLESNDQMTCSYPTDYIVAMLPRIQGYWCFITADRHFASEIWASGNDQLVAIAPNDDRKTFIALDKDTDLENKNIEYVLDEKEIDNDIILDNKEPEVPDTAGLQEKHDISEKPSETVERQADITETETHEDQEVIDLTDAPASEPTFEPLQDQEKKPVNETISEAEVKPLIPTTGGKVLLADKTLLQLDSETGSGGEGNVYDVGYGNRLVKIYKEESWSGKKLEKVSEMVKDKALFENSTQICWPTDTVYNYSGQPVGFMMPKVGASLADRESCSLENLLTDIRANEKKDWRRSHLVDICRQIAAGFKKLHSHSIYMGDVNPTNIFINYSKDLLDIRAYFIDVDSYQYKDYTCPVGLKEFTSPEILRQYGNRAYASIIRTKEDEAFAVAVLYYYILFLSEYPFRIDYATDVRQSIIDHLFVHDTKSVSERDGDSEKIWNNISEKLKGMFTEVFCEEKFIDDGTWIDAFEELLQQITAEKKSDVIFPEDYLKSEDDCFSWEKCDCCGKRHQTSKASIMAGEKYVCSNCKKMKLRYMRKIYRMECPKCGKSWTANEWDLLENLSDESDVDIANMDFNTRIQCPDCDKSFKITEGYKEDKGNSEKGRRERLQLIFDAAMKNYLKCREG